MPTVYLIRHAQGSWGTEDYDVLSPLGRRQAEVVAAALVRRGIRAGRVVSGTLARQRDTAGPTARVTGRPAAVDPRWDEYDMDDVLAHHGDGAEPPADSRALQPLLDTALEEWIDAGAAGPAARPWPDFAAPAVAAFDDLAGELGGGEAGLAFTSGGVIAAIAARALDLPDRAAVALNRVTVNAGVTKLLVGRSGTTLVSFNEHAHLDAEGDDLLTFR